MMSKKVHPATTPTAPASRVQSPSPESFEGCERARRYASKGEYFKAFEQYLEVASSNGAEVREAKIRLADFSDPKEPRLGFLEFRLNKASLEDLKRVERKYSEFLALEATCFPEKPNALKLISETIEKREAAQENQAASASVTSSSGAQVAPPNKTQSK